MKTSAPEGNKQKMTKTSDLEGKDTRNTKTNDMKEAIRGRQK